MRIAIGALVQETSTFTPVVTTEEHFFERWGRLEPGEIIPTFRDTNTPVGGFIDCGLELGFELVPTMVAEAQPSGPTARPVLDKILNDLLRRIAEGGELDGMLLYLHGSMCAEGIDDADGHILSAIRELVGPDLPIVVALDIHSNISHTMVEQADVLIGRETYPEVDMAERGIECAEVMARIVNDGLRPTMALAKIPMMWGIKQVTAHPPMREAIAMLHALEARPGVVCASIATGFPLADVPDLGASVYVVTDNDAAAALEQAQELADWIFERRADWWGHQPSTREALDEAESIGKFPIILADRDDNTGGGSPGDSTGMLRTFLEADLKDACILYIVDAEAVAQCAEAGVGATLPLKVGGKSSPLQGEPVRMTAEVMALSDGRFKYAGPMYAGLEMTMGPSAHIRQGGVHVLLVTIREQPLDTAFTETLGLDPRAMRYIGVKSSAHFRSGFESWAGQIIVVSEPSVHCAANVPYKKLGREIYPLDLD